MLRFFLSFEPLAMLPSSFIFVAGFWVLVSAAMLPCRFVESIEKCFNNLEYATLANVNPNL